MARVKISRKKLIQEPDEFLSLSQRVWLWVHDNRDKAGMIAGGVAAAVLLAVGVNAYLDRSSGQRSSAVAAAGARLVVNSDAHSPTDLISRETAERVARGAGLSAAAIRVLYRDAERLAQRLMGNS